MVTETKTAQNTISLVIVEGEMLFGELLGNKLTSVPGLEVVGVARDGDSAIDIAGAVRPNCMIIDVELSGPLDGIETALRIKEQHGDIGIVILSSFRDKRYLTSLPLEQIGGWSYLLKQSVPDTDSVVRSIQSSVMGMVTLDPSIMDTLRPRTGSVLTHLTARQLEVIELIARGYSNGAIAEELMLNLKSIEAYIHDIYQTLNLSNEPDIHARVKATLTYLEDSETRNSIIRGFSQN
jgi:DNA-binding NarL/FixJ family response regulator